MKERSCATQKHRLRHSQIVQHSKHGPVLETTRVIALQSYEQAGRGSTAHVPCLWVKLANFL